MKVTLYSIVSVNMDDEYLKECKTECRHQFQAIGQAAS